MLALINYLKARRLRHRLYRLDDRMLKDIGVCRSDIERIAAADPGSPGTTRRNIHIF